MCVMMGYSILAIAKFTEYDDQLQTIKTDSGCPSHFLDVKSLLPHPRIHWILMNKRDNRCGFCDKQEDERCYQCSDRRQMLLNLSTKARQARLHSLISADCANLVMGQLATIAAGLIQEMPGLLA
jgi:hypothetical protein